MCTGHDPASETRDPLSPVSPAVERALVANYARFLSFLERRVGGRATAEELLQSALARAIDKGVPADDEEGTVNWFYRVLQNALTDHYRSHGAEKRALEREATQRAPEVVDPELREAVCACMHDVLPSLKPEYSEIVQRVDLDERPVAEVAREMGITPNNAAVRVHRARAALRKQLERMCGSCAEHGCLECSCRKKSASLHYESR